MTKPSRLHLTENMDLWGPWEPGDSKYTQTGYWAFTADEARAFVGCWLFLHRHQADPAHFAGRIVDFMVHDTGRYKGRIVFKVARDAELEGLVATSGGWNQWYKTA
jgi:hypothetical protein